MCMMGMVMYVYVTVVLVYVVWSQYGIEHGGQTDKHTRESIESVPDYRPA